MLKTAFALPRFLVRAQQATVTMPVYVDDATPYPVTSGSYALYDADKGVAIATPAVTVPGGVPTATVVAASIPSSLAPSSQWQEEWTLLIDGATEIIRRDVHLILRAAYPNVTVGTLVQRVSDIDSLRPPNVASLAVYIDRAWEKAQRRILDSGKLPYLVLNAGEFQRFHEAICFADIFRDAAKYMGDGGRYETEWREWKQEADDAFGELRFEYDATQTNVPEDADTSHNSAPVNTPAAAYEWGRNGF